MDISKIPSSDGSPYDPIRVLKKNPAFARKLCGSFGGESGELETITQYVYQSIVLADGYKEYSELLMKMAKTEMRHLMMIGELVNKLGGELIYGSYYKENPIWFSGENISYASDIASALVHDLKGEQKAYSEYVALARQSGDRYVFAALMRIALDEMVHINGIKAMLGSVKSLG